MKSKKNVKAAEPQYLAQGVYKKKNWPWLFVIAAVLAVAATYAKVAIEFFTAPRCGEECQTFYDYTFHYADLINFVLIVGAALVLVAILCAIFFVRKRSLTVSVTALTYKKGRKVVNIPLDTIKSIDFSATGVIVTVPHVKFKFSKLKNKKEIYDTLFTQLSAPAAATATETTTTVATQSLTTMAAPMLNNPTLQGKLAYFRKLLDCGVITPEQYDKYIAQSFKADSAN